MSSLLSPFSSPAYEPRTQRRFAKVSPRQELSDPPMLRRKFCVNPKDGAKSADTAEGLRCFLPPPSLPCLPACLAACLPAWLPVSLLSSLSRCNLQARATERRLSLLPPPTLRL